MIFVFKFYNSNAATSAIGVGKEGFIALSSPELNVIELLKFELAYYDAAV